MFLPKPTGRRAQGPAMSLALVLILVILACCRIGLPPTPKSPCQGITCSGHGLCQVASDGQARCTCHPGYQALAHLSCLAEKDREQDVTPEPVMIDIPPRDGWPISYSGQQTVALEGRCSPPGTPVRISGDHADTTVCSPHGTWVVRLDLSRLPDGHVRVQVSQGDEGHSSLAVQRVFHKDSQFCAAHRLDSPFAGGDGKSSASAYQICSQAQLGNIVRYPGAHYNLRDDIHLDPSFQGLDRTFSGELLGGDHTLFDLQLKDGTNYQGLFSGISGTVKNLHLRRVAIAGKSWVGALAGHMEEHALVEACSVSGQVSASGGHAGGLVGESLGTLLNCRSRVSVLGEQLSYGGLVGTAAGLIDNCSSQSKIQVKGDGTAGGLVGLLYGTGSIQNSRAEAQVHSTMGPAGGLVGLMRDSSTIRTSQAQGRVQAGGGQAAGGLVAGMVDEGLHTIEQCWARCQVLSEGMAGGLLGEVKAPARIKQCFARSQVTGKLLAGGFVASVSGPAPVSIEDCYSEGSVSSDGPAAGFVAFLGPLAQIARAYAWGPVESAASEAAGFAPSTSQGTILDSFYDGAENLGGQGRVEPGQDHILEQKNSGPEKLSALGFATPVWQFVQSRPARPVLSYQL